MADAPGFGSDSESDDEREDALYQVIHPDAATAGGELTFFAEVAEGELLTLMSANHDQLVTIPLRGIRKRLSIWLSRR